MFKGFKYCYGMPEGARCDGDAMCAKNGCGYSSAVGKRRCCPDGRPAKWIKKTSSTWCSNVPDVNWDGPKASWQDSSCSADAQCKAGSACGWENNKSKHGFCCSDGYSSTSGAFYCRKNSGAVSCSADDQCKSNLCAGGSIFKSGKCMHALKMGDSCTLETSIACEGGYCSQSAAHRNKCVPANEGGDPCYGDNQCRGSTKCIKNKCTGLNRYSDIRVAVDDHSVTPQVACNRAGYIAATGAIMTDSAAHPNLLTRTEKNESYDPFFKMKTSDRRFNKVEMRAYCHPAQGAVIPGNNKQVKYMHALAWCDVNTFSGCSGAWDGTAEKPIPGTYTTDCSQLRNVSVCTGKILTLADMNYIIDQAYIASAAKMVEAKKKVSMNVPTFGTYNMAPEVTVNNALSVKNRVVFYPRGVTTGPPSAEMELGHGTAPKAKMSVALTTRLAEGHYDVYLYNGASPHDNLVTIQWYPPGTSKVQKKAIDDLFAKRQEQSHTQVRSEVLAGPHPFEMTRLTGNTLAFNRNLIQGKPLVVEYAGGDPNVTNDWLAIFKQPYAKPVNSATPRVAWQWAKNGAGHLTFTDTSMFTPGKYDVILFEKGSYNMYNWPFELTVTTQASATAAAQSLADAGAAAKATADAAVAAGSYQIREHNNDWKPERTEAGRTLACKQDGFTPLSTCLYVKGRESGNIHPCDYPQPSVVHYCSHYPTPKEVELQDLLAKMSAAERSGYDSMADPVFNTLDDRIRNARSAINIY